MQREDFELLRGSHFGEIQGPGSRAECGLGTREKVLKAEKLATTTNEQHTICFCTFALASLHMPSSSHCKSFHGSAKSLTCIRVGKNVGK